MQLVRVLGPQSVRDYQCRWSSALDPRFSLRAHYADELSHAPVVNKTSMHLPNPSALEELTNVVRAHTAAGYDPNSISTLPDEISDRLGALARGRRPTRCQNASDLQSRKIFESF